MSPSRTPGEAMRRARLLTLVLLALVPRGAGAQLVRGTVLDAERATPVAGAEIVLLDAGGEARVRTVSDDAGAFLLRAPGAGTYRLLVRHLGHAEATSRDFELERTGGAEIEVRMGVDAIPLEPFVVTARRSAERAHLRDFDERRLSPAGTDGYFLTREEIERRPMATPTALLRQLPGVQVQQVITPENLFGLDRSLVYLGGCLANVYVDGVLTRQSVGNTLDDLLDGADLAGVEVYPRALTAPIQYQADPDCGVVLYWTGRAGDDGAGWGLKRILAGAGVVGAILVLGLTVVS